MDIAVPNTHNLAKTIIDKQNKYQELANEICAIWKQTAAQLIPLLISPTGVILKSSGFGGLENACWPLVPKIAGSNPVEAVGFFRAEKSPARLPSKGK
jgi:hypothetical protein